MPLDKIASTIDEHLLRLRVDGWCPVEGVIPEPDVKDVRESVLRAVSSPEYLEDRDFLAHNREFVRHVAEPRILAILEALWGKFYRVGWMGPTFRHPGDAREQWHVDWPFGTRPAAGILPPFPDAVMYLTSIWMLSPFLPASGGTIIAPGTHRSGMDPTTHSMVDEKAPRATEIQVSGEAGSVVLLDSRLWHANASCGGSEPRVAMRVCYAPWWLNLQPIDPKSPEGIRMAEEFGDTAAPPMPRISVKTYEAMPEQVKPLYHHWVTRQVGTDKGSAI